MWCARAVLRTNERNRAHKARRALSSTRELEARCLQQHRQSVRHMGERKSASRTQCYSEGGDAIVRLNGTNIVVIQANGNVILSTGGFRTQLIFKSINLALKTFAPGLKVVMSYGAIYTDAWHITTDWNRPWSAPFFDSVMLWGAAPPNLVATLAQIPLVASPVVRNGEMAAISSVHRKGEERLEE